MQYNIRNEGLYIRPNSPNEESAEVIGAVNTQMISAARHTPFLPVTRLNNTASSSFLVPSVVVFEEEKKFDNPTSTPFEEYKNFGASQTDSPSQVIVSEDYEFGYPSIHQQMRSQITDNSD